MYTLFLRAGSKSAMHTALHAAGLMSYDTDGKLQVDPPASTSVSVIGDLYKQGGTEKNAEGETVPVYEKQPGYHVNCCTRDEAIQSALQSVTMDQPPTTPTRIWME